jgi:hypothetical protein
VVRLEIQAKLFEVALGIEEPVYIDEISSKKGYNYISVFVDMTARDVVFAI